MERREGLIGSFVRVIGSGTEKPLQIGGNPNLDTPAALNAWKGVTDRVPRFKAKEPVKGPVKLFDQADKTADVNRFRK